VKRLERIEPELGGHPIHLVETGEGGGQVAPRDLDAGECEIRQSGSRKGRHRLLRPGLGCRDVTPREGDSGQDLVSGGSPRVRAISA